MWAKFRTTKSKAFIVNMIALQARILNFTCPSEPTLYQMTAIVAFAMGTYDMPQQDVFCIMDALQVATTAKASKPLPMALPHLVECPSFVPWLLDGMTTSVYQGSVLVGVDIPDLDTITLYLNPTNQQPYYEYILSLRPKRIIFNPGTENPILVSMAEKNGIKTLNACTLVMLSTNQF
jgi:hypothetical protein